MAIKCFPGNALTVDDPRLVRVSVTASGLPFVSGRATRARNTIAQFFQFFARLSLDSEMFEKDDYAKWMLEDPRLNFSVSQKEGSSGIILVSANKDTLNNIVDIT